MSRSEFLLCCFFFESVERCPRFLVQFAKRERKKHISLAKSLWWDDMFCMLIFWCLIKGIQHKNDNQLRELMGLIKAVHKIISTQILTSHFAPILCVCVYEVHTQQRQSICKKQGLHLHHDTLYALLVQIQRVPFIVSSVYFGGFPWQEINRCRKLKNLLSTEKGVFQSSCIV